MNNNINNNYFVDKTVVLVFVEWLCCWCCGVGCLFVLVFMMRQKICAAAREVRENGLF